MKIEMQIGADIMGQPLIHTIWIPVTEVKRPR